MPTILAYNTLCKVLLVATIMYIAATSDIFQPRFGVQACGTSVHGEIAYRASQLLSESVSHPPSPNIVDARLFIDQTHVPKFRSYLHSRSIQKDNGAANAPVHEFEALIRENKALLLAGSFFPDWGYNCIGLKWNDAAEEAHWPPFVEAALQHLFEAYPQPWDEHPQSIAAFLFGIVAHSLSDLSWHSLQGLQEGFIRAQAAASFSENYTISHALADDGGDFILSHMRKLNHLSSDWKVPVKDMMEVYKKRNFTVVESELVQCLVKGYAGAQAKARLDPPLFEQYATQSPFLQEQVELYPMGGLYDMTGWTLQCWDGLARYLTKDPSTNLTSPQEPFHLCDELMDDKTRRPTTLTPKQAILQKRLYGHVQRRVRSGNVHQHQLKRREVISQPGLEDLEKAGLTVHTVTDPATGMTTFTIQKLGSKSSTLTTTSSEDVTPPAICRPFNEHGADGKSRTLHLPLAYASLGHALAAGDFDADGVQELVVSAPHYTRNILVPSQGSVFILSSKFLSNVTSSSSASDIRALASRTLSGDPSDPQSRFGYSLAVVDLNQDGIDDLAIGAPGSGAKDINYDGSVYVYFGRRGQGLSQKPDLHIGYNRATTGANVIPDGLNVLTGIGYTLLGADLTGSGYQDLVIGMPMATTVNASADSGADPSLKFKLQAGRVLAFLGKSQHRGNKKDTDADWQLQGDEGYGWFGGSLTMVSNAAAEKVLVVGSPLRSEGAENAMAGRIQGYLISQASESKLAPQGHFTIHGYSKFQQFGSAVVPLKDAKDSHSLLAVASRSESLADGTWQAGVLRVLNVSAIPSGSDVKMSDLQAPVVVGSPLQGSQKGSQLSYAIARSTDGKSVWVSEPFSDAEDGRVLRWDPSNGTTQCFHGEAQSRARFGSQLLSIDLDGDGKNDLIVTSWHDSRYADYSILWIIPSLSGTVTINYGA
ncbi:Glycosylphosphatidylinositol specific phospholipase D1 [Mortierella claussenii]|nr:Glycosylphosphatidylinositol specific phospholipase D1 [Mortierella claussenii]